MLEFHPDVATLMDEVAHRIAAWIATGTESADFPSPHAVGTPSVEAFLRRGSMELLP